MSDQGGLFEVVTFQLRNKNEKIDKGGYKSIDRVGTTFVKALSWERTQLGRMAQRDAGQESQGAIMAVQWAAEEIRGSQTSDIHKRWN